MKISELSSRSGVAVASIKYYLREDLLAPGMKTSETQSSYDESHLARLRLIRAFLDVGGLSVASARAVIAAIDDESMPFGVAAGIAASALPTVLPSVLPTVLPTGQSGSPDAADPRTPPSLASEMEPREPSRGEVDLAALVAERGWVVDSSNPGLALATRVIDDYAALGRDDLLASLGSYADAAELVARTDMRLVADAASRSASTETVVIGTVLGDALLAGLRRMAHETVSREFFPISPAVAEQYGHGTTPSDPAPQEHR